jgi:hypothetical protein
LTTKTWHQYAWLISSVHSQVKEGDQDLKAEIVACLNLKGFQGSVDSLSSLPIGTSRLLIDTGKVEAHYVEFDDIRIVIISDEISLPINDHFIGKATIKAFNGYSTLEEAQKAPTAGEILITEFGAIAVTFDKDTPNFCFYICQEKASTQHSRVVRAIVAYALKSEWIYNRWSNFSEGTPGSCHKELEMAVQNLTRELKSSRGKYTSQQLAKQTNYLEEAFNLFKLAQTETIAAEILVTNTETALQELGTEFQSSQFAISLLSPIRLRAIQMTTDLRRYCLTLEQAKQDLDFDKTRSNTWQNEWTRISTYSLSVFAAAGVVSLFESDIAPLSDWSAAMNHLSERLYTTSVGAKWILLLVLTMLTIGIINLALEITKRRSR